MTETPPGAASSPITAATPAKTIAMMAGVLQLPTEPEVHISVMKRDWNRIRQQVNSLSNHERQFNNAGWSCVGVLVGAVLAAFTWAPARAALPASERADFAWVWPAVIAVIVCSVAIGAVCFVAAHKTKNTVTDRVSEILEEMDSLSPADA